MPGSVITLKAFSNKFAGVITVPWVQTSFRGRTCSRENPRGQHRSYCPAACYTWLNRNTVELQLDTERYSSRGKQTAPGGQQLVTHGLIESND